jgi:hypothetical protein
MTASSFIGKPAVVSRSPQGPILNGKIRGVEGTVPRVKIPTLARTGEANHGLEHAELERARHEGAAFIAAAEAADVKAKGNLGVRGRLHLSEYLTQSQGASVVRSVEAHIPTASSVAALITPREIRLVLDGLADRPLRSMDNSRHTKAMAESRLRNVTELSDGTLAYDFTLDGSKETGGTVDLGSDMSLNYRVGFRMVVDSSGELVRTELRVISDFSFGERLTELRASLYDFKILPDTEIEKLDTKDQDLYFAKLADYKELQELEAKLDGDVLSRAGSKIKSVFAFAIGRQTKSRVVTVDDIRNGLGANSDLDRLARIMGADTIVLPNKSVENLAPKGSKKPLRIFKESLIG